MNQDIPNLIRDSHDLALDAGGTAEVPAIAALARSDGAPMPTIVFPPDTRRRVSPTQSFPWNAQGQLVMKFRNGEIYTGTGTLIDKKHVLTAAHNLFGNDIGGWAQEVWFIPARDGDYFPYGCHGATKIFVTEEYRTLSPPNPNATPFGDVDDYTRYTEDYGLVRLERATTLPILGMYAARDDELGVPCQITGYPGDKPEGEMWTDAKPLTNPDPLFLFYRINTYKGESGASIIADINLPVGQCIAGIHVAGDPRLNTNFGVRLDSAKIKRILGWMNS